MADLIQIENCFLIASTHSHTRSTENIHWYTHAWHTRVNASAGVCVHQMCANDHGMTMYNHWYVVFVMPYKQTSLICGGMLHYYLCLHLYKSLINLNFAVLMHDYEIIFINAFVSPVKEFSRSFWILVLNVVIPAMGFPR